MNVSDNRVYAGGKAQVQWRTNYYSKRLREPYVTNDIDNTLHTIDYPFDETYSTPSLDEPAENKVHKICCEHPFLTNVSDVVIPAIPGRSDEVLDYTIMAGTNTLGKVVEELCTKLEEEKAYTLLKLTNHFGKDSHNGVEMEFATPYHIPITIHVKNVSAITHAKIINSIKEGECIATDYQTRAKNKNTIAELEKSIEIPKIELSSHYYRDFDDDHISAIYNDFPGFRIESEWFKFADGILSYKVFQKDDCDKEHQIGTGYELHFFDGSSLVIRDLRRIGEEESDAHMFLIDSKGERRFAKIVPQEVFEGINPEELNCVRKVMEFLAERAEAILDASDYRLDSLFEKYSDPLKILEALHNEERLAGAIATGNKPVILEEVKELVSKNITDAINRVIDLEKDTSQRLDDMER